MNFWNNLHPLLRRDQDNYGSANYAVLNALADSLSDAESDTISKKIQLQFSTATGDYLDEWGSWFGVARRTNEDDDTYRERIKYYFLIPRSTIEGIIRGIQYYLDDTGAKISIYEPWKNIFYLNKSHLNGEDHLPGYYYRYGIINVNIDRPMSQAIYDAIQAFKPAGVKFYVTVNPAYSADTTVEVLANLQANNLNLINQKYGFTYASRIPVTFADRADTLVPITDYFKTNNSALNGKDVLAGSPLHNVTYWNSLKTSDSRYKDVPVNLLTGTSNQLAVTTLYGWGEHVFGNVVPQAGTSHCFKVWIDNPTFDACAKLDCSDSSGSQIVWARGNTISAGTSGYSIVKVTTDSNYANIKCQTVYTFNHGASASGSYGYKEAKLEVGSAPTPWSPNPADPEYYEATDVQRSILSNDNYPYVTLPHSFYEKYPTNLLIGSGKPQTVPAQEWGDNPNLVLDTSHLKIGDVVSFQVEVSSAKTANLFMALNSRQVSPVFSNGAEAYTITWTEELSKLSLPVVFQVKTMELTDEYTWSKAKVEIGTTASPWSPNPADPEYYLNMIDGQLSIYNLLTTKYAGLLNTYAGSTSYEKVKSLIADSNVSLGIVANTDNPISINGTNISKGKQSVIIDKSSVVYTASDIYIPVSVTGTSDTNIHYLVANIQVKKQVPGLGVKVTSSQVDTTIAKS